jgi:uncharacterized protein (TIGR03067 family)
MLAFRTAESADANLKPLQGEWSLASMTFYGIKVEQEYLKQTTLTVAGDQLTFDKFWHLECKNPIDPVTKSAEGYLNGDPGIRFQVVVRPDQKDGQIDLILSGLVPATEEADLPPEEKALLRERKILNKGIYRVEGDQLTICWEEWSPDGNSSRPADFTAKEGSNRFLMVLKKKSGK